MFTGIVQGVGAVCATADSQGLRRLSLSCPEGFLADIQTGASIAVDGVCLTVAGFDERRARVDFDVMQQTMSVTTLGRLGPSAAVNLERAARQGAEVGGHALSGHVDFLARLQQVSQPENNHVLRVQVPDPWMRYIFAKGYVAVNGASLTVAQAHCDPDGSGWFEVWLIPETLRLTTFGSKAPGDALHIEVDRATQALVETVRRTVDEQTAGFSEMRMREGMNQQDLESVTGIRRGFVISERMEATVMAERLEILSGNARSATALGAGLGFGDRLWQGDARVEWRRLDAESSALIDNTADSLMSTVSFARKVGGNWTGLIRNYVLFTDDRSRAGSQLQNRFQIGAAYRPLETNNFDLLLRYENKLERNAELAVDEKRRVDILSASLNLHPSRRVWVSGRVAAKDVNETLVDVEDDYRAWLFASRIIFDIGPRLDVSAMAGVMVSSDDNVRDEAFGLEVGYLIKENIWLSVGHNFVGFYDRDLSGRDPTQSGWYVRMRMKFDEKLLQSQQP